MDDLDAAIAQWSKDLALHPRLHRLANLGRAAAQVEQRRQPLGRERFERKAEPASLGFEHRVLDRGWATCNDASSRPDRGSGLRAGRSLSRPLPLELRASAFPAGTPLNAF